MFVLNLTWETHFSGILSMERSGVQRMERSGETGRGLREVLRGEELRKEEKDSPCLRISCTARSLMEKITAIQSLERLIQVKQDILILQKNLYCYMCTHTYTRQALAANRLENVHD